LTQLRYRDVERPSSV